MWEDIQRLLSDKRIVYITDPSKVEYRFEGNHLRVWDEKIPYKELLGVIFLQKGNKKPRVRKVPVIYPPYEFINIETTPYPERERFVYFNQICHYVGRYLQSYLKRYLGKRTPYGGIKRVYTFFGVRKYVRENTVFIPIYTDCDNYKDERLLFQRLAVYMSGVYNTSNGYYGLLTFYTGVLLAYHLGKRIPADTKLLASIFLPAAYALTNMLHIRSKVFDLNDYSKIPLRGQVFIFLNELFNNGAFAEHLTYSVGLLK